VLETALFMRCGSEIKGARMPQTRAILGLMWLNFLSLVFLWSNI
jgi:hypothetical protein